MHSLAKQYHDRGGPAEPCLGTGMSCKLSSCERYQPQQTEHVEYQDYQGIDAHIQDLSAWPEDKPVNIDGCKQDAKTRQVDIAILCLWQRSLPRKQRCQQEEHGQECIAAKDIADSKIEIPDIDRREPTRYLRQRCGSSQEGRAEQHPAQPNVISAGAAAFFKYHARDECNDCCDNEDDDHPARTPFFTLVLGLLFLWINGGIRSAALLLPGQSGARLIDKPETGYPCSCNQEIARRQACESAALAVMAISGRFVAIAKKMRPPSASPKPKRDESRSVVFES